MFALVMNGLSSIFSVRSTLQINKCFIRSNTIYALSSAYGKCGVSVIRVSGPQTRLALRSLLGNERELVPRHAYLRGLYHPKTKEIIDRGLVLWFPSPASFTGEDCCEFQVHGSIAVVAAMMDALGQVSGLRPATAGEFTKRAFFGNKMDLTEVEGLADLIHAETEAQRKQALLQSSGSLSRLYNDWRNRLIRCAAHLEAYIDFAEDENIDADVIVQLTNDLGAIKSEIKRHLNDQRQGEMLRDGVRTVIVGAPNVGKSSFLNAMCQRDVAIVSDTPGTTRDVIESTQNFGGYPVRFVDTAGLRNAANDKVEAKGIMKAKQNVQQADLVLLMADAAKVNDCISNGASFEVFKKQYLNELELSEDMLSGKILQLILNKTDLLSPITLQQMQSLPDTLNISCKKMETYQPFLDKFSFLLKKVCGTPLPEAPRLTHSRYRMHLEQCVRHIDIFIMEYSPDVFSDMAISAQKLRLAIKDIEKITGHISTEAILDVIFKDFCVGK